MKGLYTAAEVRAAEEPVLAATPEGALMQRAAIGLATVCLRLLGRSYGVRVTALVGAGNNGGDALFAGAHLAERGAQVTAVLLDPERAHRGGLAALRRAGDGSSTPGPVAPRWCAPTSCSTASWASAARAGCDRPRPHWSSGPRADPG